MEYHNVSYQEGISCGEKDFPAISDASLKEILSNWEKQEMDEPVEHILRRLGASPKTTDRISKYDQEIVGEYNSETPDELIEQFELAAENFYRGWIKGVSAAIFNRRRLSEPNDNNNLIFSKHLKKRLQQRGITISQLNIGLQYGDIEPARTRLHKLSNSANTLH